NAGDINQLGIDWVIYEEIYLPNDRVACDKVYVDSILILYKKSIVEINVNQAFYGCGCERI
ncbi:hypothetical protein, partial [Salmonella enterica]|uniref:hypothetical protein n=1 Tax=Salmonella enterica TaxID=28901 RepID=UPI001E37F225